MKNITSFLFLIIFSLNFPFGNSVKATSIVINEVNSKAASILMMNANDDFFISFKGQAFTANVLVNDIPSTSIVNGIPVTSPSNGIVTIPPNGTFLYIPNATFTGTDSFSYSVCNGSSCDTAMVHINILEINIVKDTIVLGATYLDYYCFNDTANHAADTLNNAVFTTTNDSCFNIYGDYLGTDTTALISSNAITYFYITVVNGVWAGDTDDNALVNNRDLLNIGLAYNSVGVPRANQNILWNGNLATDWNDNFANGLNYKYADTDGNGIINAADTNAIIQNWGLTYSKNGNKVGSPIYLETDSLTITNDSLISVPIMLGTIQAAVNNIYGLAFSVSYNWELVKQNTASVSFNQTWIGSNNNSISIQKDFYNEELIEVAITRTDGNNISGFGQIGTLNFTIQDDIIRGGDSVFVFNVFNVKGIENNENRVEIQAISKNVHWRKLIEIASNTNKFDLSNKIKVYPNPASDWLTIETRDLEIEQIEIFDLTGQKVLEKHQLNKANQLNISNLSSGLYILNIQTDKGKFNQKLVIQ